MFTKTIHLWFFMRKIFLCTSIFLYTTNCFCTRTGILPFHVTRSIYKPYLHSKIFFIFPNMHLWFTQKFLHIHLLLTHTRIPFHASFTQKPSIHIFLLHTCINKNLFLFFMNMTFIHRASFFLLGFLVHFFLGRRS